MKYAYLFNNVYTCRYAYIIGLALKEITIFFRREINIY